MKTTLKVLSSFKKQRQKRSHFGLNDAKCNGKIQRGWTSFLIVYCETISHYYHHYFITYLCLDTMVHVSCSFINILDAEFMPLNLWSYKYPPFRSYKNSVNLVSFQSALLPLTFRNETHTFSRDPTKNGLSWFKHCLLVCQDNPESCFCHSP